MIAMIRAELDSAFGAGTTLPNHILREPERVVVTLGFKVEDKTGTSPGRINFQTSAGKGTLNSLSLEFRYHGNSSGGSEVVAANVVETRSEELTGPAGERVREQLSQVFGPPGFDSSARATVLREAFEGLSGAEIETLIQTFAGSKVELSSAAKRSAALVDRVCKTSSSSPAQAKKILANVFREHSPIAVLSLISSLWKTQEAWID